MPKDLKENMNKSSNIFGENTNSKGNDKKNGSRYASRTGISI